jgi:hypothetical protein
LSTLPPARGLLSLNCDGGADESTEGLQVERVIACARINPAVVQMELHPLCPQRKLVPPTRLPPPASVPRRKVE